ncbi:MAG TPA: M48 family metallopeptidase [Thermoanaerobaculia bacterium]|nr:M48 family metallopeptidase [Thermoanaerobaculia bacterium]
MYKRNTTLALVLVTFVAAGCGSTGGGGDFNLISIEEEWQLGAQLSQDVEKQVRLNNDAAANAYIRDLGSRIVRQAAPPFNQLPWEFHVVQDDSINAFAIPGGHVYVNTGLIKTADSASELAGVMAHEIAHVLARHSTEQLSRQYGLSVVAGAVLGQNPGQLTQIAAQIVAGGTLARFSREAEREADNIGIQAMSAAGFNPNGMASMFEKLLQQRQGQPGRLEQFFSTHPLTEERIRDSRARAEQIGNRGITDEPQFQEVRRRL